MADSKAESIAALTNYTKDFQAEQTTLELISGYI